MSSTSRAGWSVPKVFTLCALGCAAPRQAAPARPGPSPSPARSAAAASAPGRHAIYVEGFGKGGLFGLGYDYHVHPRVSFGGVVSYYGLRGEHVFAAAPYVGVNLVGVRRHRLFAHFGPLLVHLYTPSPVIEWAGRSESGVAVELTAGYEYRNRVLFRVALMGTAGKGGVAPWAGVSLGWAP